MVEQPDDVGEVDPAVAVVVEPPFRLIRDDPAHLVEVEHDVREIAAVVPVDIVVYFASAFVSVGNPVPPGTVTMGGGVGRVVVGTVVVGTIVIRAIVNPPLRVALLPSGFMTTTSRGPSVAAEGSATVQVIFVEEVTTTSVAVISGDPVPASLTVAPGWNPVPARLVIVTVVPRVPRSA